MKWWENLCQKCGYCCFKKKLVDGVWVINFNNPCEYLDIESNLCFFYEKRFEMCPECKKMTIFKALFGDFFPDTCGYVVFFRKMGFFKIIKRKKI
ncbi:MAG: hypothetical protein FWC36_09590 [Spirochaetes bacterium]|nr:hypothetical protein [Spirochaetota bacterium]